MKLDYGIDVITDNSCPTNFNRDKILKVINILLLISLVLIFSKYFISTDNINILSLLKLVGQELSVITSMP